MDWAQILVIILAIFLAIFLALAIALLVLLLKVTKQIKAVAGTAERTAQQFEKAAMGVSKVSSPLMILRLIKRTIKNSKK